MVFGPVHVWAVVMTAVVAFVAGYAVRAYVSYRHRHRLD